MSEGHVLVISHDRVGRHMAGPGIRYRELARVLAGRFRVTLAVPDDADLDDQPFQIWPYRRGEWNSLAPAARGARVVVACGDSLVQFPVLAGLPVPLVVDGYDPHTLETLALWAAEPLPVQAQRHQARLEVLQRQCQAADFLICASERQRDWWLGLLEHQGRINPRTYGADPSLRNLLDVVPYGLPAHRPQAGKPVLRGVWPGLGPDDRLVLWGGGLWEWLDPLTGVRAIRRLVDDGRGDVRLVFPGTRHPNPDVPDMPMQARTVALADELALAGRHVLFGDWVAYDDWPAVLLEADVGLALHPDTAEARLAFRSRVLDYAWAGLPMVLSRGDATAELVAAYGLGQVVDCGDDAAVARALARLLDEPIPDVRFDAARHELTWEQAAQPLLAFCENPHRAVDRLPTIAQRREKPMSESVQASPDPAGLRRQVEALSWYHTLDLGAGIVTPGAYDHRPYLHHYDLPEDLTGKTALDVGAASGFFAFEMERRGASVTAVDLPEWDAHDFGPCYEPDMTPVEARCYLREPILLARQALGSQINKVEMSIYDLSPESIGEYDVVFCGSLLIHLTDPIQALWRLQSVTREQAIVATPILPDAGDEPRAAFVGHHRGDGWWLPNRACLEAMVKSAGFVAWEWVSEFRLDYRDGSPGPDHAVIRAWNLPPEPSQPRTGHQSEQALGTALAERDAEISRLRDLVSAYEQGRFMRLMRWLHTWRKKAGV